MYALFAIIGAVIGYFTGAGIYIVVGAALGFLVAAGINAILSSQSINGNSPGLGTCFLFAIFEGLFMAIGEGL